MKIQLLVATMNQANHEIISSMNIKSDAIIANQCNFNKVEEFLDGEITIKFLSFNEIGVGLNRNNALLRSTADICILADDDMVFIENYEEILTQYYSKLPDADVIIFNLIEKKITRPVTKSIKEVNNFNYMKYGAARITFKRTKIMKNGISFNQFFGGGSKYSSGEDTLFLKDCLLKNLKIYAVPAALAELMDNRESTWFEGRTAKYYYDKGALFAAISKKIPKLLSIQFILRHKNSHPSNFKFFDIYKLMCKGILDYRNL